MADLSPELAAPPARTYLYVPGDRPALFPKAVGSGTDAVILDLEDGVGVAGKDAAHEAVAQFERAPGVQWWVRVDPVRLADGVLCAVRPGTTGVFLPGAELALLDRLEVLLAEAEAAAGLEPLKVVPLLETPRGVAQVRDLAAVGRVHRLAVGEADMAAALGLRPSADRRELWPIRSEVVLASALCGLAAPVGPVQVDLTDTDLLRESTEQLVRQGYNARTLIHPSQVEVVHGALAPSDDELAAARDVVATFEAAHVNGSGVAVDSSGRMVDLAVVRSARALLGRA